MPTQGKPILRRKRRRHEIDIESSHYSEALVCLYNSFRQHGGVVFGRGNVPVPFRMVKSKHNLILEIMEAESLSSGEPFTLNRNKNTNTGEVEYCYGDVLNVARPAGPVQNFNFFRTKLLYHSTLRIAGMRDITDHIYSFLNKPTRWNWKNTQRVYTMYSDIPITVARTRKDKANLLLLVDSGESLYYE